MADKKEQIAKQLFGAGVEALEKKNFAYAAESFRKCVDLFPEKLFYRESLRGAERKKYADNHKGAPMAAMRTKPAMIKLLAAKARKKWQDVINYAEDALSYNPWDVDASYEIGVACRELEMTEMSIWALQIAAEADRDCLKVFLLLADIYEEEEQFQKAVDALNRAYQIKPTEHAIKSRSDQMSAQKTLHLGGYESEEGPDREIFDTAAIDKESKVGAKTAEEEVREEIEALGEKLAEEPDSALIHVQIAENHLKLQEHEQAAKCYKKALDLKGGSDPVLKSKLIECQLQPLRKNFVILKDRLEKVDKLAPDAAQKIKKLRDKYKAFDAQIVKREVELYRCHIQCEPNDFQSHYELGYRLLRLGEFDEAIKSLQQGRKHAAKQSDALFWLGYAFWQKKNHTLAETNFAAALEACNPAEEEERSKILYNLGRVAQDRGDTETALNRFNEVAALDYGYKDVAKRIDELTTG